MTDAYVQSGIYRHYKGPLYQVLSVAHDANHDDRTVVVYMPLQLEAAHLGPRMAVRTIEDFTVNVHVAQAGDNWPACPGFAKCKIAVGGRDADHFSMTHRARFTYLGPVLTAEMLPGVTL